MKASSRILDTIKNHSDQFKAAPQQQRGQHGQVDPPNMRIIFIMLNNFAMHYLQVGKLRECSQILQLAQQMYKYYQSDLQDCPQGPHLQAMFYANFSAYHLMTSKGNGSNRESNGNNSGGSRGEAQDLQLAKKYINAAIQLSMLEIQKQEPATDGPVHNSRRGLKKSEVRKIFNEMNCAINFNNRAVIQMKNGCYDASREHSKKAISLLEPRVFSFIYSGLIPQVAQAAPQPDQDQAAGNQKSKEEAIFHELLQVLLVSYFNMAMSMDRELRSREIYLRGMQLFY